MTRKNEPRATLTEKMLRGRWVSGDELERLRADAKVADAVRTAFKVGGTWEQIALGIRRALPEYRGLDV